MISSRPLEATAFKVENIRMAYVFYESGLSINVMYTIEDAKKRAVGFKLSDGMEIPEELASKFKFARQKSKLAERFAVPTSSSRTNTDRVGRHRSSLRQPSPSRAGKPPVAIGPHRSIVSRTRLFPWRSMAARYSSQSGCSPEMDR